jgi:hypothetical protein
MNLNEAAILVVDDEPKLLQGIKAIGGVAQGRALSA